MTTESSVQHLADEQRQALLKQAADFGFRVEMGDDLEEPHLFGKFWWSLSRPGWMDVEVSDGEFYTQRSCEDAIIVAHANELMEPGDVLNQHAGDEFPEPHMEQRT